MLMNTAIPIKNNINNNFAQKVLPINVIIAASTKNGRTTPITMPMVLDPYRKNVY